MDINVKDIEIPTNDYRKVSNHQYYPLIHESMYKSAMAGFPHMGTNIPSVEIEFQNTDKEKELNELYLNYYLLMNQNILQQGMVMSEIDKFCQDYLAQLCQNEKETENSPLSEILINEKKRKNDYETFRRPLVAQYRPRNFLPHNYDPSTSKKGKQKFEKSKVSILKEWFFQHIENPYPQNDEKIMLSEKTDLPLKSIDQWFTNARRRLVPPQIKENFSYKTKNTKNN
eukprot:TRINITY_DN3475_c0_g1_i1.p1 TRINITY_DN3475_c0_g1~~TRINITY_DN3475_c0_g1_i1.p1  ORF type:complete len:263 (-),score=63.05 TRINITY_DN3475_c0_g1_i1:9-692(-)